MNELSIKFANIIIGPGGQILVAVSECGLDTETALEISLRADMSFDVFQGLDHVGHVQSVPAEVMKALATTARITLLEVGADGPARKHEMVCVRSCF